MECAKMKGDTFFMSSFFALEMIGEFNIAA